MTNNAYGHVYIPAVARYLCQTRRQTETGADRFAAAADRGIARSDAAALSHHLLLRRRRCVQTAEADESAIASA